MYDKQVKKLIERGKIKIIDLPSKRREMRENQILLLRDDWINLKLLLEKDRIRGTYIHAFNALERIIDIILIENGYQAKDRYARRILVREILGEEFLEEYDKLFDKRKDSMYDVYGVLSEDDVREIIDNVLPELLDKAKVVLE